LGNGKKPVLPPNSFVTCGSDDTVRIWNIDSGMPSNTLYRRNIYSEELLKTLYIDPGLGFIKEQDTSLSAGEKDTLYDQRNGVRCIRISPNGKHLASGDRSGNIRVHELQFMDELCKIEAHDAEVLCLEYSLGNSREGNTAAYLASASRDRLIHVFNAGKNYGFLTTLDDHSSSITAVRFLPGQSPEGTQMVSCGADKSIIFRDVSSDSPEGISLSRANHIVGKTTLYDMELDRTGKHILTACQDRNIRVYSVVGGKHSKTFKGSPSEDGTLIKVALDRSGIYVATSCTDKSLSVYDYHTGELMASMCGHSELVTGLAFSNDCRHLISVSGDSCVFVWRLPTEMVATMQARVAAQAKGASSSRTYIKTNEEQFGSPLPDFLHPSNTPSGLAVDPDPYRFSVGKLPGWAKTKIGSDPLPAKPEGPKNRWAARGDLEPFQPPYKESDYTSEVEHSMSPVDLASVGLPSTLDSFNDADVDEYSTGQDDGGESTEPETGGLGGAPLYFGEPADEGRGECEYPVNAMDVEELRRSQRRYRAAATSRASEPGESDVEEEEELHCNTPGTEQADRNFCVSMESVDQVGRRERFMQSTFESLSGTDEQTSQSFSGNSISNAWREQGSAQKRNASTIAAARQTRDAEQNRRREELQRRIEETRMKLQKGPDPAAEAALSSLLFQKTFLYFESPSTPSPSSGPPADQIGYRSMKGSQSINDLSSFPDASLSSSTTSQNTLPRSEEGEIGCMPDEGESCTIQADKLTVGPSGSDSEATLDLGNSSAEEGLGPKVSPSPGSGVLEGGSAKGTSQGKGQQEQDGTALRRACSLSDLNKPNVPRRVLPAPPGNVSGKRAAEKHGERERDRYGQDMSRPSSSSDNNDRSHLNHHRRKSIDDRMGGGKGSSGVLSRLEQHERMLAERERERRLVSMGGNAGGSNRGSRGEGLSRPKSVTDDSDRDLPVPSYMRSTSASVRKEKMGGGSGISSGVPDRQRRKSGRENYSQSQGDLRMSSHFAMEDDSSSDEEGMNLQGKGGKRSSSSDRRQRGQGRGTTHGMGSKDQQAVSQGPHRAKSERDLSRVAKVKLGGQTQSQRTKMKTTTIISGDGGARVLSAPGPAQGMLVPQGMPVNQGVEAVDVTRAPFSSQLVARCGARLHEAAEDLIKLYKRVSLDDDLDDSLRLEMLGQLGGEAAGAAATLRLVTDTQAEGQRDNRQGQQQQLASAAAVQQFNQFLARQQQEHRGQAGGLGGGGGGGMQAQHDLSSNPYLQHMIENYSNLMFQNMSNRNQESSQDRRRNQQKGDSLQGNGGPSWC